MPVSRQTLSRRGPSHCGQSSAATGNANPSPTNNTQNPRCMAFSLSEWGRLKCTQPARRREDDNHAEDGILMARCVEKLFLNRASPPGRSYSAYELARG